MSILIKNTTIISGEEKLADYVSGFLSLRPTPRVPIGAIVSSSDTIYKAVAECSKAGMKVFNFEEIPLLEFFASLGNAILSGEPLAIRFKNIIPNEISSKLKLIADGVLDLSATEEKTFKAQGAGSFGGRVLLCLSDKNYEKSNLEGIVTSVCRI